MQATVARLETELTEVQRARTALQQDSAQQLESLERLRRDNAELQQRVSLIHAILFASIVHSSFDVLFCLPHSLSFEAVCTDVF